MASHYHEFLHRPIRKMYFGDIMKLQTALTEFGMSKISIYILKNIIIRSCFGFTIKAGIIQSENSTIVTSYDFENAFIEFYGYENL